MPLGRHSPQCDDRVDLDGHVERQMRHAHRGSRSKALRSVEVENEIGEAVDHGRVLREAVDGVDVAVDLEPAGDRVEVTKLALDRPEDVQRRELRGRNGLLDRQLTADLAELAAPALAVGRTVPRDVGDVPEANEPAVGERHAWRDHLRGRNLQPALGEALGNRWAHRGQRYLRYAHALALPACRPTSQPRPSRSRATSPTRASAWCSTISSTGPVSAGSTRRSATTPPGTSSLTTRSGRCTCSTAVRSSICLT